MLTNEQFMRLEELQAEREELLQAYGDAQDALFDAMGTLKEADAQGEYARCDAALSSWLTSPEGLEWEELDNLAYRPN